MANETRASRKSREDENSTSSRNAGGKSLTSSSGNTTPDDNDNNNNNNSSPSGLRRSAREKSSSSNKTNSSTTSTATPTTTPRKSERLDKQTLTPSTATTTASPSAKRKSEKEKESAAAQTPLRRSVRGKTTQGSSSSSGSKKSEKSGAESGVVKKKLKKKEKSVRQLTMETKEVSEKEVVKKGKEKKKIMNARSYRALFRDKVKSAGSKEDGNKRDKLPQGGSSDNGGGASNDVSQIEVESREKADGLGKIVEESSSRVSKPAKYAEETRQTEGSKNAGCCPQLLKNDVAKRIDDFTVDKRAPDGSVVVESGYGVMSSKRKRDTVEMGSNVVDAVTSSPREDKRNDCVEMCAVSGCSKRQRMNDGSEQELGCCNGKINQHEHGTFLAKGRGETEARATTGLAEPQISNLQCKDSPKDLQVDGNQNACAICKLGGKLLWCCDGRGCGRSYHLSCLDPPLRNVPFGVWLCVTCVWKKIKSDVYSVSKGVESVWNAREVEVSDDNGLRRQKQFFVKYKGLAHVHNRWMPESQLLLEAPSLVAKFNKKNQGTKWKQCWTVPRRLLQKRLLMFAKQHEGDKSSHADSVVDCRYEWLVKWLGLHYDHATWEFENASFMNTLQAQSLMRNYENRHEKANRSLSLSEKSKKSELQKGPFVKLSQSSAESLPGFDVNNLDFVNNLRERWHKKQSTVILNDQDGIMKVISFILSLLSDVSRPFLIVTTVAALHSWDEKFFRLAPSVDSVVYYGDDDLRKDIRMLEFYSEGGCIMFQILITPPEAILEDLNVFESINWEAVIVDECQISRINSHFEKIKMLSTDMRLLLVNGQLKDNISEHLLSLLDCPSDFSSCGGLMNSSHKNGNLKDRLSKFIANDWKSDSSRFLEHWVPVHLSHLQLEQYCATLFSNSSLLCSPSKSDLVEALREILTSFRKCCDHPYILDPMLQTLLIKDGKDILDVGIKACGKLQLLDQMLFEIRKRGLRVLILFQSGGGSIGGGSIGGTSLKSNIGDILDDYLRYKFGQDAYERIDGLIMPSKKQSALHNFNNENGRFVFLLETRACLPSIKLSSVDVVIIYGSDWNPMNDLRNLQKITIDSKFEQIKVFRLYSSFTVEERVLILARQHKTTVDKSQNVVKCPSSILMWGAAYLFNKLAEFHSGNFSMSNDMALYEQSMRHVIEDFTTLLSQTVEDSNASNSVILKVKQGLGGYDSNFPLTGELKILSMDEELPHVFWKKLLDVKQPQWKYLSCSSQRNRKRVQYFDHLSPGIEGDEVTKKRKKVANNNTDPQSLEPFPAEGNIVSRDKEGTFGAHASNASLSPDMPKNLSDLPESNMVNFNEKDNLHDLQMNLYLLLKPEIAKLCKILQLPEDVKDMADNFLEYVMNNHQVSREPATILQAFQISLCWTAASLLKHKLKHKESLVLAKQHLNFGCKKEEAEYVYSMLRCLKKLFLYHTGKKTYSPKASSLSSQGMSKVHSLSELLQSNLLKVTPSQDLFDGHVPPSLALAQKDVSKSISDVEKKCDKQMKNVIEKQREELKNSERHYEEEKGQLEKKQRTEAAVIRLHSNSSMRTDKLKLLDIDYGKKFEELKCQMEECRKLLEDAHLAARNKLQDRKAHWVDGLKSWAQVELFNKWRSSETGHNHENVDSSDSCSKDQINRAPSTSYEEVPHEFLCSNDDEGDVLQGVVSSAEQIADGATSMLGEVPLKASVPRSSRDGLQNVASVNASPCGKQIPGGLVTLEDTEADSYSGLENATNKSLPGKQTLDDSESMVLISEFPGGVPDVGFTNDLENFASINPSPSGEHVSNGATSCMHGTDVVLDAPETAPSSDADANTIAEKDVVNTRSSNNVTQVDGQEKVVPIVEQDCQKSGEVPLGLPETAHDVLVGGKTGKVGGNVLLNETLGNQGTHSLDRNAGFNQQGVDVPSGVPETVSGMLSDGGISGIDNRSCVIAMAPFEVDGLAALQQESACGKRAEDAARRDSNGACVMEPSGIRVEQDGAVVSGSEAASGDKTDSGNTGREVDGVCPVVSENGTGVGLQDGSVIILDQIQELSLALEDGCTVPTAAAKLPEVVATGSENQSAFQCAERAEFQPHDVASDQLNVDAPVVGPVVQSQLLPSADSTSAGEIESHDGHRTGNSAQYPLQLQENNLELSDQAVLQSETQFPLQLPVETHGMPVPIMGATPTTSSITNNPVQTAPPVRMPLPSYEDPLQHELERIMKETDQTINIHDEAKLRLKSDCEKEIEEVVAQIRRKYDAKFQEMESEFLLKKQELDANRHKVLMNKILAEAFRSKCMDIRAPSSHVVQQELTSSFMQQLIQQSSQQTPQRPSIVNDPSAGHHTGALQTSATSSVPPSVSSLNPTPPTVTPAVLSTPLTRPPHISSISAANSNLQARSEIRAPAPHLQPFRSSVPMSGASISSPSCLMPGQQVPSNNPPMTPMHSQIPLRLPPALNQSVPQNRAHQPETVRISPQATSSLLGLLRDVDNLASRIPVPPINLIPPTDVGYNLDTLVAPPNGTQTNTVCPSEVVCLSDDD